MPKRSKTCELAVKGVRESARSHSLEEFWKSALHKSMSAKAPGAGEDGEGAGAARVRAWRPTRQPIQPDLGFGR